MKINQIVNPNIGGPLKPVAPSRTGRDDISGNDEVTAAGKPLSFSKAMLEAQAVSETRSPEEAARIAEIAAAIRQGTYRIESGKIADKILESVLRDFE